MADEAHLLHIFRMHEVLVLRSIKAKYSGAVQAGFHVSINEMNNPIWGYCHDSKVTLSDTSSI